MSIRCPECGSDNTGTVDSRENMTHTIVRRRKECFDCGCRFTTHEMYQLNDGRRRRKRKTPPIQ